MPNSFLFYLVFKVEKIPQKKNSSAVVAIFCSNLGSDSDSVSYDI